MKTIITLTFSVALIYSLNACTTLKRYSSLSEGSIDNGLVSITVSSSNVSSTAEQPKFKSIFDLTDKGQLAALSNKTNKEVTELLNEKFLLEEPKEKSIIDLTTSNIRVTLSISRNPNYLSKEKFSAYDRIEDLNYNFEMGLDVDPDVKFTKWNKYTTEYGTLDIGTLEYNQSFSVSLDALGKIGASDTSSKTKVSSELSTTGKASYTQSRKENQLIKQRYIQLTGSFKERNFKIHQQGTRETELAGNVSIDLDIKMPADERILTSFSNLYNKSILNPTDSVKINHIRYRLPDISKIPNGVNGKLNFDFVVRHINMKENTFLEYDDQVNFICGKSLVDVTLIKKEDLFVPIYFIQIEFPDSINKDNTVYKSLTFHENKEKPVIQFITYESAKEFYNWFMDTIQILKENDLKIKGQTITFNGLSVVNDSVKKNIKNIQIALLK